MDAGSAPPANAAVSGKGAAAAVRRYFGEEGVELEHVPGASDNLE